MTRITDDGPGDGGGRDLNAGVAGLLQRHAGMGPDALYTCASAVIIEHGVVRAEVACGHAQVFDGDRVLDPPRGATTDTIFDIASLTKVCATTAAVMCLVGDGTLDVDIPVGAVIPDFRVGDKDRVRLRHLLDHRAGLWEWWPLYAGASEPAQALERAIGLELRYPVDHARHYSDLGMILAGEIVHRVAGEPLDGFLERRIFGPLVMTDTCFRPPARRQARVAATSVGNPHEENMLATGEPYPTGVSPDEFDNWRRHTLVGEVNDGNAHHAFDGVAGHAGLFATAGDLARFGAALLEGSELQIFHRSVVDRFTNEDVEAGQGLGFWTDRLGDAGLGHGGFGHSGFTGCELLVFPARELVVVLLTNRLHVRFPHPDIAPAWRDLLQLALSASGGSGAS